MKNAYAAAVVLLSAILLLGAAQGRAQVQSAPNDVDGTVWMRSTSDEKRAFLYGAGNAVVLEYYIRTKHNEQPSRFVKGWVDVFGTKTWGEIEKALDQYYTNNPDKTHENVFQVIWSQMIQPYEKS